MAKVDCKPREYLSPVPAVMVTCGEGDDANIITLAWVGTINSVPPIVTISLQRHRHSYPLIKESGEFIINLVDEKLVKAMDYCGCKSGKDVNKWQGAGLTPEAASQVKCPGIAESLVQLECKVREIHSYETHDAFIAEIVNTRIDESIVDEKGNIDWKDTKLVALNAGHDYFLLEGEAYAKMGFSLK